MNEAVVQKLEALKDRFKELEGLLAEPSISTQPKKLADLSREYAKLEPIMSMLQNRDEILHKIEENQELLHDQDADIRIMVEDENRELNAELETLVAGISDLLLAEYEDSTSSLFLEVRQGTGGDEACLFAGNLLRMYSRYVEAHSNWSMEIVSTHLGEMGGFKEAICRISGKGVLRHFKHEAGTHRVQRIPATESQGRIHTSACTVAVLPVATDVKAIEIDKKDLRLDLFRASGAGGQHINKTDSAVRITHLPTNIVVECQDERSQHRNKAKAMDLLQAKLLEQEKQRIQGEEVDSRRAQVGSGDRSERIRTYNYPQGRVTDHRINLTVYKLDEVLSGDLQIFVDPLMQEEKAKRLAELVN